VSTIPSAAKAPAAQRSPQRAHGWAPWLVAGCYLLAAVALSWRMWADPASREQSGDAHDIDLFAWFLRYEATAVGHGHLPALVTTALNAPQGVNLMWNTAILLPGTLLTPVTLLAGPQVSLTVLLTLGFAGSAASLMWVLRRWGASLGAAALGGAVYGFSPAMIGSGIAHYHLEFAVLPPLIIDAVARIVTGRARPLRGGLWLGLLAAGQLFTGEELLLDTALACLVLVAALAVSRPAAARERAGRAALGLSAAAAVMLVICGRALWVQFRGPLTERGRPLTRVAGGLGPFVSPPRDLLLHTGAGAGHLSENLGYLGWPLLAVLLACAIWFWRNLAVRAAAVTGVLLDLLSAGGGGLTAAGLHYPPWLLPWYWLAGLPGMAEVLPDRFSILADGAAGAVLTFCADLALASLPRAWRWTRLSQAGLAAIAAVAVLPLIPLPFRATIVPPVPAGWQTAFARLRLKPGAPVLVLPLPAEFHTVAMRWQAETGEPQALVGGYFLGPGDGGLSTFSPGLIMPAEASLTQLGRAGTAAGTARAAQIALIRADVARWRPAAIVAGPGSPPLPVLDAIFGRPSVTAGQVVAWRYRARGSSN
jgi:hypothetical protein